MTRRASIALALLLAACDHDHDHGSSDHAHEEPADDHHEAGHGHGHGHGDGVAIGITRWSEGLELFAEHPPVVVGEEAPLLAHLTWLEGFLPVEGARVRLTLEGPTTVTAEAGMLRSGIYEVPMRVATPGTYRGRIELIAGGEGSVDDFTIEVYPDQATADAAQGEESDDGSISFLKEQQWRVRFDTAFAREGALAPTVEVAGELTTPPSGTAHVHAPVAGRVLPPRNGAFATPGSVVHAGDLLATVAPTPGAPEDATRAAVLVVEAEARLEESRAELERARRLLADRAAPERRVTDAARAVRVAEANLSSARQASSLYRSAQSGRGGGSWRITAPIDGVLDTVEINAGEAVTPDDLLFRIVDPETVWLEVAIPERWAGTVRALPPAACRLAQSETWRPLGPEGAAVVHFGRTVDPDTRTVRAVFALTDVDAPGLRVGAAVEATLPIGEEARGVLIPAGAVLDVEGRPTVYVQVEGEAFAERAVRLGPRDGAQVLVEAGVEPGERVVTVGAVLVRLASQSNSGAVGHGHVH